MSLHKPGEPGSHSKLNPAQQAKFKQVMSGFGPAIAAAREEHERSPALGGFMSPSSENFLDISGAMGVSSALERAIDMQGLPPKQQLDNPFLGFGVGSIRQFGRTNIVQGEHFGLAETKIGRFVNQNIGRPGELFDQGRAVQALDQGLLNAGLDRLSRQSSMQLKTVSSPDNFRVVSGREHGRFTLMDKKTGEPVMDFKLAELKFGREIGGKFARETMTPGSGRAEMLIEKVHRPGGGRGLVISSDDSVVELAKGETFSGAIRKLVARLFSIVDDIAAEDVKFGDNLNAAFFKPVVKAVE